MTYHIGIAKRWMLLQVEKHGLSMLAYPEQFKDKEEALQALRDDPRETFLMGKCNNRDETGKCLGHKNEDDL